MPIKIASPNWCDRLIKATKELGDCEYYRQVWAFDPITDCREVRFDYFEGVTEKHYRYQSDFLLELDPSFSSTGILDFQRCIAAKAPH